MLCTCLWVVQAHTYPVYIVFLYKRRALDMLTHRGGRPSTSPEMCVSAVCLRALCVVFIVLAGGGGWRMCIYILHTYALFIRNGVDPSRCGSNARAQAFGRVLLFSPVSRRVTLEFERCVTHARILVCNTYFFRDNIGPFFWHVLGSDKESASERRHFRQIWTTIITPTFRCVRNNSNCERPAQLQRCPVHRHRFKCRHRPR